MSDEIDELLAAFDEEGPASEGPPQEPEPERSTKEGKAARSSKIPSIGYYDLNQLEIKPRPPLLVLHGQESKVAMTERDYGMVFAERGVGKTWWTLAVAVALASGGRASFLKAVKPRRVVYVDGEMPLVDMRDRINALVRPMTEQEQLHFALNFTLVNRELVDTLDMPSLTNELDREDWAAWLNAKDPAMVILDNISSLTSGAVENNEEDWAPIGDWAVQQRRHRAVAWVHHASRGGTARGTSKREDPLDFIWKLKGVEGQGDGALITLEWKKARNVRDEEVKKERMLQLHSGGPEGRPSSVWNEIPKVEGIIKEMDQRDRNLMPIATAIYRRGPSIGMREFRQACREEYKTRYQTGLRNDVIDRAYPELRDTYTEAA